VSRSYDDKTVKVSHDVWEVMHNEAKRRGFALIRDKVLGDGRIIMGTVGAFIKGLSSERDWKLDDSQVDLVRRYLKASGNVVVKEKIEQYQFRIFIRETWSNATMVPTPVPAGGDAPRKKPEDKVSKKDAGEDRDPSPVTYRCADCGATFDKDMALRGHRASHTKRTPKKDESEIKIRGKRQRLNKRQKNALAAIYALGGEIFEKDGRAASIWADAAGEKRLYISSVQLRLQEAGLLTREGKEKLTYRYALTDKGREVASKLPKVKVHEAPKQEKVEHKTVLYDPEKVKEQTKTLSETTGSVGRITGNERVDNALGFLAVAVAGELHLARKAGDQQEKLDLIAEVVKDVNDGKTSPLKALGDIEAALKL
jgi:hypothetical protein